MAVTRFVVFAAVVLLCSVNAAAQGRPDDDPLEPEPTEVMSAGGAVPAEIAEQWIDFDLPGGYRDEAFMIGVFVPSTGQFWWTLQIHEEGLRYNRIEQLTKFARIYQLRDKLVSFRVSGSSLLVRESSDRVTSLEDGFQRALAVVNANLPPLTRPALQLERVTSLASIESSFLRQFGLGRMFYPPKIVNVSPEAGRWKVIIEAPSRQRAIVTVDSGYRFVGMAISRLRVLPDDVIDDREEPYVRQMWDRKHGILRHIEYSMIPLAIRSDDGRESKAELIMVRQADTGTYWWVCRSESSREDAHQLQFEIQVIEDRIAAFRYAAPNLGVREMQGTLHGFDAIRERALAELERTGPAILAGDLKLVHESDITKLIAPGFFVNASTKAKPVVKMRDIQRKADRWEVTLSGPSFDFATISFDPALRVADARTETVRTRPIEIRTVDWSLDGEALERDVAISSRHSDQGRWNAVFEPRSRLLWWRLIGSNGGVDGLNQLLERYTFFLAEEKLIGFFATSTRVLIRESTTKVRSVLEAAASAQGLADGYADEDGGMNQYIVVELPNLGMDFILAEGASWTPDLTRLESIAFKNDRWELRLKGVGHTRALVILDASYKLIESRRLR